MNDTPTPRLSAVYDVTGCKGPRRAFKIATGKTSKAKNVMNMINKQFGPILRKMLRLIGEVPLEGHALTADEKKWKSLGLEGISDDECVLIRRLCEKAGYSIGLTRDGLIIPPKIGLRPVMDPKTVALAG